MKSSKRDRSFLRHHGLAGLLLVAVVLVTSGASSAGEPSRCAQLQYAAAGEAARRKADCAAKAAALGAPVDAGCLAAVDGRLARRWARAAARGDCPTPADSDTARAVVDGFLASLSQALTAPVPGGCCDSGARCFGSPAIDASTCQFELLGTLGAPGSVCDGATGDCVAPAGTGGSCCEFPGAVCSAVPNDDPADCVAAGGQSFATAVCQPGGTCTAP